MFEIARYTAGHIDEWNTFVAKSKNGTFLFDRYYMDYHSDRFKDHSLMFYKQGRLYALLPANDDGEGTLWSHKGLTFGGLIMSEQCRAEEVCELILKLNNYLKQAGFQKIIYKSTPWHYCLLPSQEDLYAITQTCRASIHSRDIASVVDLHRRLPFSELRKRGVKKAQRAGVVVSESNDLEGFWALLSDHLQRKFNALPVHSLQEISLLRERFPENIHLYIATTDGRMVGGTLLYCSGQTVKTQYISANEEGLKCGAIDLLFDTLLMKSQEAGFRYFDFGTSNMPGSSELHASLIHQKEGFGARAVCYDTYEWEIPQGP